MCWAHLYEANWDLIKKDDFNTRFSCCVPSNLAQVFGPGSGWTLLGTSKGFMSRHTCRTCSRPWLLRHKDNAMFELKLKAHLQKGD